VKGDGWDMTRDPRGCVFIGQTSGMSPSSVMSMWIKKERQILVSSFEGEEWDGFIETKLDEPIPKSTVPPSCPQNSDPLGRCEAIIGLLAVAG